MNEIYRLQTTNGVPDTTDTTIGFCLNGHANPYEGRVISVQRFKGFLELTVKLTCGNNTFKNDETVFVTVHPQTGKGAICAGTEWGQLFLAASAHVPRTDRETSSACI
jgi:hypothetical protein